MALNRTACEDLPLKDGKASMCIKDIFHIEKPADKRLLGTEWITLAYTLFTAILIVIFWSGMNQPWRLLTARLCIVVAIAVAYGLYRAVPCRFTRFLRHIFPLALLGFWYPDTYEFCRLFPNLDHLFAQADQWIFGYQPALEFCRAMPQMIWSELFNMGYFSYYLFIVLGVIAPLVWKPRETDRTAFLILAGFFFYYLIYLFLPVAGPQFYFPAIPAADLAAGTFPAVGDYFRTHTELAASADAEGLFKELVEFMQKSGERPTAAFPSSHVGMSTFLMVLIWRVKRVAAFVCLPFYVLLCAATVYIQAHYFVDVVGGFVTAFVFLFMAQALYDFIKKHNIIVS